MYCTTDEVREVSVQITASSEPTAWTDEVLEKVIERASRIFDNECNVAAGYFEASSNTLSTKIVYGDGTNLLRLPPYVPGSLNPTLVVPDGYTAQEFVEQGSEGDQYLVRSFNNVPVAFSVFCGGGWYPNVPITVTAKWGFTATPADVKHAVIEFVINLVKEVDPATIKMTGLDGQPLREKMPPRTRMVADRYKARGVVLV